MRYLTGEPVTAGDFVVCERGLGVVKRVLPDDALVDVDLGEIEDWFPVGEVELMSAVGVPWPERANSWRGGARTRRDLGWVPVLWVLAVLWVVSLGHAGWLIVRWLL